jgi:hypothetical protein
VAGSTLGDRTERASSRPAHVPAIRPAVASGQLTGTPPRSPSATRAGHLGFVRTTSAAAVAQAMVASSQTAQLGDATPDRHRDGTKLGESGRS